MSMSACSPVGARVFFAQNPGLTPRAIAFRPFGALKGAGTFQSRKNFKRPMRGKECPLSLGQALGRAFVFTVGTRTNAANSDSKSICGNL